MNSLKKGEGIPLLNFVGGPGVPLLNFEGGPEVRVPRSWCHFYTMLIIGPFYKKWSPKNYRHLLFCKVYEILEFSFVFSYHYCKVSCIVLNVRN